MASVSAARQVLEAYPKGMIQRLAAVPEA